MIAIGHKLLVAAYEVLSRNQPFVDLGEQYLTRRTEADVTRKLVHRLESLGYEVALSPREVGVAVS